MNNPQLPGLPARQQQAFLQSVWSLARQIPPGQVATYGQIASLIPCPDGVDPELYAAFRARWVGTATSVCPDDVPWQRVINSQGKVSGRPGAETQRRMLEKEGVTFDMKDRVDLKTYGWPGPGPR